MVLDTTPSMDVVSAVAERLNHDRTELSPLSDVVDPDALDALLADRTDAAGHLQVRFTYCGMTVTVRRNGTVEVTETDGVTTPR